MTRDNRKRHRSSSSSSSSSDEDKPARKVGKSVKNKYSSSSSRSSSSSSERNVSKHAHKRKKRKSEDNDKDNKRRADKHKTHVTKEPYADKINDKSKQGESPDESNEKVDKRKEKSSKRNSPVKSKSRDQKNAERSRNGNNRQERSRDRKPRDRSRDRRERKPRDRRSRERSRERKPRERSRERRSRDRSRQRNPRDRSRDLKPHDRRSRERSRDRRSRERSRDRKPRDRRSRERSQDRKSREASREKSITSSNEKSQKGLFSNLTEMSEEERLKACQRLVQERKERMEKEREEMKRREREKPIELPKTWPFDLKENQHALDDDEKEEDDAKDEEEEDEDSLEAFMQNLKTKIGAKVPSNANKQGEADVAKSKVKVVLAVAEKKTTAKRELIEQDQDGLAYSSEEEAEDLEGGGNMQTSKSKKLMNLASQVHEYLTFRKDFYVEVPELAKMSQEDVKAYRQQLGNISIKGKNCPKPIKSWAQCGVSKKILEVLKKNNYEHPTPIQAQAIPAIMSGRDVIGVAQTGCGKTLAFLIPMFRHILDQPRVEEGEGPIAVIMAPTRELAMQITSECGKFAKALRLRVNCVYGGGDMATQIAKLKRGVDILVFTPGRMIEMLVKNNGRVTNMNRCTYLVLDEADRMFDMGFEPQLKSIVDLTRPDRQTLMFTATFQNRMIETLARRILTRPLAISVGQFSVVCQDVTQRVLLMPEEDKLIKLIEILNSYQDQGSAIVFVEKQEDTDKLLHYLLKQQFNCVSLHGGIDQGDRECIMADFKAGKTDVLVATSVAERGLDVDHLILVVNFDRPGSYEVYVHRCGRTGRAGNKGFAYTFLTPEEGEYAGHIIKALELSETPVPEDVQLLWKTYKDEQEAAGHKVKDKNAYGGKGYKFNEEESQKEKEKKKLQSGIPGNSDDDSDTENIEKLLEAKKTTAKEIPKQKNTHSGNNTRNDHLEMAKTIARSISLNKIAEPVLGPQGVVDKTNISKTLAAHRVAELNSKLNYFPTEEEEQIEEVKPEKLLVKDLEINGFSNPIRYKLTHKETLRSIEEHSETNIAILGVYAPNEKKIKEGERPLYLSISGLTELALSKAKSEIVRLIQLENQKANNSASKTRYSCI